MSEQDDTPTGGGSVFDRVKRPAGEGPAGGSGGAGAPEGPEVLGTPPAPTDSTQLEEHTSWRRAGVERRPPRAEDVDLRAERRAERLIAAWFTISVIGTLGFIVTNFVGDKHKAYYTPCLGLAIALAVGGLGVGMILWAKRLMPHEQAVQDRHTFKSTDELMALYNGQGVTADKNVIAYCRIGERSSHTWFVLKYLLGFQNVKNYDGSWTEYGSLVGVPIAVGDDPGQA